MKISFSDLAPAKAGTVAVGVWADREPTPVAKALDGMLDGQLGRAMAASPRFTGKKEEVLTLTAPGAGFDRVVLFGLGARDAIDAQTFERAGAQLYATFGQQGVEEATIQLDGLDERRVPLEEAVAMLAFGARLRSYRFDKYRTKQKPEQKPSLKKLVLQSADKAAAKKAFAPWDKVADGVFLTRDLVSEPANVLHPESFAERCKALTDLGIEVEILDEKKMRKLGMGALLGVGQGSEKESRLVVMQWNGAPDPKGAPIAFVGKGVCFDTGGISIKPADGMWDMKWDMGGAGVVTGLMAALAGRKAKVNVVGVIGLVENMPDGKAQRPGDIVTSMSGQTIEVLNTDAEGRLVLADALWYTEDRFKPSAMIDLATLTGAIIIALGQEQAGLFASDDTLADRLLAAAKVVDEPIWRMPLGDAYDKLLDSDIADVKNISQGRWGGAVTAAQFLKRFVRSVPWAHLDIAGVTWSSKDKGSVPKGGTGFGVRLLDRLVADHYEAKG